MIIVSACLLGRNCKYSGENNKNSRIINILGNYPVLPVCPEELGGLSTPRPPAEIIKGNGFDVLSGAARVFSCHGDDFTRHFSRGAEKVKEMAKKHQVSLAILKERSPSCGVSQIYDGTFSGQTVPGCGVTTAGLRKAGIKVISEEDPLLEEIVLATKP
ncbi:MAG: DUF523 domain-containing protein [Bacillota bacterium]